ncbi:TonB-dependent receptor [Candidatus Methylopumilus rimovensis]|uniref:TonB-dependent receptor n=1 Tax=Candidatus Methylopumilus rimovensis TaxID=2588535 RepID=A0AAE6FTA5_9PROT|nr:TonB-dependent receptor [Candidatus Methylopumilus rimovensis]QDD13328.1 TonB-dependent receptor [Candidatus Methylopumilus rimovensis]
MKLKLSGIVALALASSAPLNAADKLTTNTINVYSATPLHSIGLPLNMIPANIQMATPKAINEQVGVSLADYMNNNMQSVTTTEMGGNPWQPEITFRGFSASPLLGMPQGISTYIDGVRVNEPFGDVTLWDKIPNFAIGGMQLVPGSNPLYGLNTLGGAIAMQTKSGRDAKGASVEFEAGSWDRQRYLAQYGGVSKDGSVDYFIGHQTTREDGWRQFSPSHLNQTFAKTGWQSEKTKLDLSYIGTNNKLVGNGFTPEFLLSGDRDQIHTSPDWTNNYYHHLALNGSHWVNNDVMLSGHTYYRKSNRHTRNGDLYEGGIADQNLFLGTNYASNANKADDVEMLGSVMNRTKTKQDNLGFTLQAAFNQDLLGKKNQFIAGVGYDYSKIRFNQNRLVNLYDESEILQTRGGTNEIVELDNAVTQYRASSDTEIFDSNRAFSTAGNGVYGPYESTYLKSKQQTYSIFATDTLSINQQWHVNAGMRYNYTRINNRDQLNPVPTADNGSLTADATYARLNPTVGLTFTPSDKSAIFGSYSESSRAPTSIELGCSNPARPCLLPAAMADDPPLKQVVAKTYDFGARGYLNDSIKWNASVYHTVNHDDIQFVRADLRNHGYFANVGRTQRQGFDIGLAGQQDKLRWNTSYSFIKATYDGDLDLLAPQNSSSDDDGVISVKKGDYLPSIPKHQLKLRAQYQVTPDWSVGTNVIGFTQQYIWGNENNRHQANNAGETGVRNACGQPSTEGGPEDGGFACGSGKISGYVVVNLDSQYNIGKGWSAFAKAINIFDQKYNVAGRLAETMFNPAGEYGAETNVRGLLPGAPRAAWIGFRYEFGGAPEAN